MSYRANVFEVMMASPGDVSQQKGIAEEVIRDWNAAHSRTMSTILLPVSWETNSSPEMGDRPQAIINKQVLENADLLIGIFWTRLGTPTGEYASGTVEEIEKHIESGKLTMLYFSSTPVSPESVDTEQLLALREFKEKMKSEGRVEFFDSNVDFRTKFTRQLAQTINENSYFAQERDDSASASDLVSIFKSSVPEEVRISDTAQNILVEAAQDEYGMIFVVKAINGYVIQTHGKAFTPKNARERAELEGALKELERADLIVAEEYEGPYKVTTKGYDYADKVRTPNS